MRVSGEIPFKDVKILTRLFELANATNSGGTRVIYRVANNVARAVNLREATFSGTLDAPQQAGRMSWLVTFTALRKSVAAGQQVIGQTVHIGTESTNALTMLLDTIDLLAELARQCASHTHPGTGSPSQASAFTETATKAGVTRGKYQKIIA